MQTRITRRRFMRRAAGTGVAAVLAPAVVTRAAADEKVVYVNTWGGSWTAAEEAAFFKPFTEATGIEVRTVAPVSFAKLKAQVQSGSFEWDCSNANPIEVEQAINEGLVETIDWSIVDKAKIPDACVYRDHGLAGVALATCLVYRTDRFPEGKGPASWADFWDVERFPGNRSLYDRFFTNLAFALLADGVPKDQLYPVDLDRAFASLDRIKPHIKVWWKQGSQSQQLIGDGEVDMIAMWNARAQEMIDRGDPLKIVWNGAESYTGFWYVPKGTPRAANAWRFLEFISQAKPQADFAKLLPYGPTNPGAFDYLDAATAAKLPTAPAHLAESFTPDVAWLAPRAPELRERWATWLGQ